MATRAMRLDRGASRADPGGLAGAEVQGERGLGTAGHPRGEQGPDAWRASEPPS
jgi:hypothetical protein